MENTKPLDEQSQIYSVKPFNHSVIKTMLFWFAFAFALQGLHIWSIYQKHEDVAPAINQFGIMVALGITAIMFVIYLSSKISEKLPVSFEMTHNGITRFDKYGNKIFIAWDELKRITRGRGLRKLSLESTSAGKRMFIPEQVERFQQLSEKIFEEYRVRKAEVDPCGRVIPFSSSVKKQFLFIVCLLWFLALAGPAVFIGMSLSNDSLNDFSSAGKGALAVAMLFARPIFLGGMAVYNTRKLTQLSQSQLIVDDLGITQIRKDGNEITILWNEIGDLKETKHCMQGVLLKNLNRDKKIIVSEVHEGYLDIHKRICDEYMKCLEFHSIPVVIGEKLVIRPLIGLFVVFIVCCFLGWALVFRSTYDWKYINEGLMVGFIIGIFVFGAFGNLLSFVLRRIDSANLDSPGVTLHRMAGKIYIPWDSLDSLEWNTPEGSLINVPCYTFLLLKDKKGKTYKIQGNLDFRLKLYAFSTRGR